MANDLEMRLRADRLFIEHLCKLTGKSASALASGAGMASTTLNRFVSKKVKPKSILKDVTIEKIAKKWGLDYFALAIHRKKIEQALREGKTIPSSPAKSAAFWEPPPPRFAGQERDPLLDRIMNTTYKVWFDSTYKNEVEITRLPGIVRLLYSRGKSDSRPPSATEIKKRATDMFALIAMEAAKKK